MIDEAAEAARKAREKLYAIFHAKRLAYVQTFMVNGRPHPNAAIVLKDLRRWSGVGKGGIVISPITRTADPMQTAYLAGQRDVYLRIAGYLGLDGAAFGGEDND